MGAHAVITHALKKGDRVGTAWGPGVVVEVMTYAGEALVRPEGTSWGSVFDHTHGRWIPVGQLSAPAPEVGVSLAKEGAVPRSVWAPVSDTTQVDVGESAWWGVPAHVVRGWISDYLRRGCYADAAWLSVRLHSA